VVPAAAAHPDHPAAATGDAVVTLTEAAQAEVRRLIAAEDRPGQGLRLGVAGGGCSGLVYKVEFDVRKDGDVVVPCAGFDVLLDRKSTIYLRGVTLDHNAGLSGRGFVFRNPNASNTCGCGESFAV
jgi:iron-sulfur cluster assembly protein